MYNHKIFDYLIMRQLLKYGLVGGLAFLTDFLVFSVLVSEVHYQIANYCGLFSGLLINYFLSKTWVFQSQKFVNKKEVFEFIAFTAFGFLLSGFGMYIGIEYLRINEKLTKFGVACIVFVMNFLARKFVIFKES